jgi:signal transduction histidine kinase
VRRILLLLDHRENQELLGAELAREHEVIAGAAADDLEQEFDLCVLDGPSLDRLWERVRERKEREQPIFLPVLLVTSRPGVKMITRHLWRSVDELIITPIEKEELRARIAVLLRGRSLSLALRQRAEEAEQASRTRDEVLAMVAHDLRIPLDTIMMSGSFLAETAAELAPGQHEHLRVIGRAAERMNRLTQDLLEVSGIEAGHFAITPAPEAVASLVEEACGAMASAAAAKVIRLVPEVGEHLPRVRADRDRVLQVLGNLLGNALKFTPAGGEIRIRAAHDGACVRFSVSDTGPGIDEADLPYVFDRFWQARRARDGGAGLGLAIVRGIVAAHAGESGVESDVGRGTTFWFTLPVAEPAGTSTPPGAGSDTAT